MESTLAHACGIIESRSRIKNVIGERFGTEYSKMASVEVTATWRRTRSWIIFITGGLLMSSFSAISW